MKLKVIAFILCGILLISSISFASAVAESPDPPPCGWGSFPEQKTSSYTTDYTRALQTVAKYYNPSSITIDGSFGTATKNAVKKYQSYQSLSSDGIVGYDTWTSMRMRLGAKHYITGGWTGNGLEDDDGGYIGYKIYQRSSSQYTSLYYFRVDKYYTSALDVYKAAPGSTPGTWYWVNPRPVS